MHPLLFMFEIVKQSKKLTPQEMADDYIIRHGESAYAQFATVVNFLEHARVADMEYFYEVRNILKEAKTSPKYLYL